MCAVCSRCSSVRGSGKRTPHLRFSVRVTDKRGPFRGSAKTRIGKNGYLERLVFSLQLISVFCLRPLPLVYFCLSGSYAKRLEVFCGRPTRA